jgi:hypothetical protein
VFEVLSDSSPSCSLEDLEVDWVPRSDQVFLSLLFLLDIFGGDVEFRLDLHSHSRCLVDFYTSIVFMILGLHGARTT